MDKKIKMRTLKKQHSSSGFSNFQFGGKVSSLEEKSPAARFPSSARDVLCYPFFPPLECPVSSSGGGPDGIWTDGQTDSTSLETVSVGLKGVFWGLDNSRPAGSQGQGLAQNTTVKMPMWSHNAHDMGVQFLGRGQRGNTPAPSAALNGGRHKNTQKTYTALPGPTHKQKQSIFLTYD